MSKLISLVRPLFVFLLLDSGALASAGATDLVSLGERLVPAYTAMSYERLCEMLPEWAQTEPQGALGAATAYAQQAKKNVIASLSYEQSLVVLRFAADAARTDARRQLAEKVISEDKILEDVQFKGWCHGYVKEFIRRFIARQDINAQARPSVIGR
jgi:hypothetical protein